MTIRKSIEKVTMKIKLDDGIVNGKQKTKNKTFNKIRVDVEDRSLYEVGQAISNLHAKDTLGIIRVEEAEIML